MNSTNRWAAQRRLLPIFLLLGLVYCVAPGEAPIVVRPDIIDLGELRQGDVVVVDAEAVNVSGADRVMSDAWIVDDESNVFALQYPTDGFMAPGDSAVFQVQAVAQVAPGEYRARIVVASAGAAPQACAGPPQEEPTTIGVLRVVILPAYGPQDDPDNDGWSMAVEQTLGTDPFDGDTDNDGLRDADDGSGDVDGDGLIDALDLDSDGDGLPDSVEIGGSGDADPSTTTDPDLADTDGDGLDDGVEDSNGNGHTEGEETAPELEDTDDDGVIDGVEAEGCSLGYDADSDEDGLLDGSELEAGADPCLFDTDGDGLGDGLELGLVEPERESATVAAMFQADANPATTTNPLDFDSDGGGVSDGVEDANQDGALDPGERDPMGAGDDWQFDTDDDGLIDAVELELGLDPFDADTDDDGFIDGVDGSNDTDQDGVIDALDGDSDNDGVPDSVEGGWYGGTVGPDTDMAAPFFVPDGDPDTVTDPDAVDTDADGLPDGVEDADADGRFEAGETDPGVEDTDGDSIIDGDEDQNGNGAVDADETDPTSVDTDADGVDDGDEGPQLLDPRDDDSDDDGLMDGTELTLGTDPLARDSDGDGLTDGLEVGLTAPEGEGSAAGVFVPDGDPTSVTSPLLADSDGGGVPDGVEDVDRDGVLDEGERDPNDPGDELWFDNDGDGLRNHLGGGTDCDDADATVYPGAEEICDLIDQDCDGDVVGVFSDLDRDGAPDCVDADADGDGFLNVDDCGPFDAEVAPGAKESCDSIDSDCDGDLVDGFDNKDGDRLPDCVQGL